MRPIDRDQNSDEAQSAARQRQEASRLSLDRGGLPLNAIDRLQEQAARQGTPGSLFTSDLSVSEFLLTRQAGVTALGQVTGSTVFSVGTQWRTPNWRDSDRGKAFSYEMEVLTGAFYQARHRTLGRMQQEAALLGATGVVGVRLRRSGEVWGESVLEFVAIGTAIRETGRGPASPAGSGHSSGPPGLSNLSGQEFWALRQAGYRPAGLVVGNCAYAHIPSCETRRLTQGTTVATLQNQELTEYSEALYQARTRAMQRMEDEARAAAAEGVVGVQVEVTAEPGYTDGSASSNYVGMLYHFTAIGTAIAPLARRDTAAATTPALPLR